MNAQERYAASHMCPDCGPTWILQVRWHKESQTLQCWCTHCGRTDGFVQRKSTTQLWRENPANVDIATANRLEEKYGGNPMNQQALATIDEPTMLARMEKARWVQEVPKGDRPLLAQLAIAYGLDPVMGELTIYEGKPLVTFTGWLRKLQEHPDFAGVEDRPMTDAEKAAYGYTAPVCWIAKVYKRGWAVPAVGTATADPNAPYRNNPVEKKFPQAMARKRAIIQAGKVGFLHALPFAREATAEEVGVTVDVQTGEIIAGAAPEPTPITPYTDGEYTAAPADDWPDPEDVAVDPMAAEMDDLAAAKADALKRFEDEIKAQGRTRENVVKHFESKVGPMANWSLDSINAVVDALKASDIRSKAS